MPAHTPSHSNAFSRHHAFKYEVLSTLSEYTRATTTDQVAKTRHQAAKSELKAAESNKPEDANLEEVLPVLRQEAVAWYIPRDERLNKAKQNISDLSTYLIRLTSAARDAELEILRTENDKLLVQKEQMNTEQEKLQRQVDDQVVKLKRLEKTGEELEGLQAQHAIEISKHQSLTTDYEKLRQRVEQQDTSFNELQTEKVKTQQTLEKLRREHDNQTIQYKTLQDCEEENKSLEQRVEDQDERLADLERVKAQLQEANTRLQQ